MVFSKLAPNTSHAFICYYLLLCVRQNLKACNLFKYLEIKNKPATFDSSNKDKNTTKP